ncbi:MAG: hypothetical protein ABI165_16590 [Bryobacteraceae bacterium]
MKCFAPMPVRQWLSAVVILLFLFLAGCDSQSDRAPAIGVAYVGPETLNLRKDLAPKSPASGTVKHGDRLEILATRRRFIKVRTPRNIEGWTDGRLLMTPEQMDSLRHMAENAALLPSQGAAAAYEPLNMHTEPSRQAPSFHRISENAKVDVVAHRVAPRVQNQESAAAGTAKIKPPAPARKPKAKQTARIPRPPMPIAPHPPANWLALSRSPAPETPAVPASAMPEPPKTKAGGAAGQSTPAAPMDDWDLVRTRDGKAGWVLSRLLAMAIPDEVAQYAEGHRITSYFALSDVPDGGRTRHNWLWTTITHSGQPYEFDSVRVFTWSLRRHRYETAYIEKNVKGYYPVETSMTPAANKKLFNEKVGVASPAFSVVTEADDGQVSRTLFAFSGNRVRVVSREPYRRVPEMLDLRVAGSVPAAMETAAPSGKRSWFARLRPDFMQWFK